MNLLDNESRVLGQLKARSSVREQAVPAWWRAAKRCTDVVLSFAALTVAAPVLLLAALGIAIVSPGSPFFAQERVGRDGRRFRMLKLRTMVDGAHLLHDDVRHLNEVSGPVLKIRNDPRLHALGSFLRRTSIDEVPNFINVLRGDMSIVGPRPPLPGEVEQYDVRAWRRLGVKPGITCLWQISGRSNVSFDDWIALDIEYIEHWSPWRDIAIIVRTIPAVVRGDGAH